MRGIMVAAFRRGYPRLPSRGAQKDWGRAGCSALPRRIRGFFRHLAREGIADNASRAVRTPRIPRTLPRPLSVDDAARTIAEAGTRDIDWLAARDTALLTLLYGAGLRISEAR